MRDPATVSALIFAALAAACVTAPRPIPVVSESGTLARLEGSWTGHYSSPVVDRRGSIVFELEAGRDTAYGDVIMIPRGWTEPLGPAENPAAAVADAPVPQTLSIRFVRVRADTVSGTLEPYRDPDCGCLVDTTFIGVVEDGVIEGKFTARPSHGTPYEGTWRVTRGEKE